jgi:hypothetical protein
MKPQPSRPLPHTPLDLVDNLRLRFAVPDDFDAWTDFNERMREGDASSKPNAVWANELMSGKHPTTRASDFTVVEDTGTGKIVSSLCLIPQTWSYSGISFGCGRIEHVGTDPLYRRRGLVRAQMDVIHALSAAKGDLMQSITGIPWYYRQFGYEYALDLYHGRTVQVAAPNPDAEAQYRVRPLTDADHNFVRATYDHAARKQPFSVVRSDEHWQWEFSGRTADSAVYDVWLIIEDSDRQPVGFILHHKLRDGGGTGPWHLAVTQCVLAPGMSPLNVMPELLSDLPRYVQTQRTGEEGTELQTGMINFMLGRENPIYAGLPATAAPSQSGYAWFIRVPDLVAFLHKVRPALEENVLGTPAEGYTGTLTLDFFRSGLRFEFDEGRITGICQLDSKDIKTSDAEFPDLTFLQVLGGHRTCAQLQESHPDSITSPKARPLLAALFPPFTGNLWHSD